LSGPRIPRRNLLWLAGTGLAATPARVLAAPAEGQNAAAPASPPAEAWVAFFAIQRIWGYADRTSLLPGEPLDVMLAGGPGEPDRQAHLEVFRIGPGGAQTLIWKSDPATIVHRPATKSAAAIGPDWPATFANIDTSAWPPGCYSADVVEQVTATRDVKVAVWIVRNPKRAGAVLVRLGTNTYQAYNDWGGHSLYPSEDGERRGVMVSFDRPAPPSFFEYDVYLVGWLEALAPSLGGAVDYASNFDIHRDPTLMDGYRLVISASHDEYWSGEEFDAFERRIFKRGGNTAFFGADAAYYQVRYGDANRPPGGADEGRQIVCYKDAGDPILRRAGKADAALLVTDLFRQDARRPETMLMGVAYQSWFDPAGPARFPYLVATTDLPFFEGTGWKVGDPIGDVVGYEWDNRDPDGDGRRLWDASRSRNAAVPAAAIQVLFQGQPVDVDGKPGLAEAVYWRSKAGAQVFSAGSIRWAWGLGKEGFVQPAFQRFNENLVRALSR
jgi:hypothetical protein